MAYIKKVLIFTTMLVIFMVSPCYGDDSVPVMYSHYIDVGQGDATLLEFPCGAILIDTGAQSKTHVKKLETYLDEFFNKRKDLNRTLESIVITHNHPDHTKGLKKIIKEFNVKRLIHNGKTKETGRGSLAWALKKKDKLNLITRKVTFEEVIEDGNKKGLTGPIIDPIDCENCNPVITVLSGGFVESTGWTAKEYLNKNNHSMVIRVDFGQSSFIFMADLEHTGIEKICETYGSEPHNMLDSDVCRIGHHGSYNATDDNLLESVTPHMAVISMGEWDFGKSSGNPFSTYSYGHPREGVIELLRSRISDLREEAIEVMVFQAAKKPTQTKIEKKIYATAWDGTVVLQATLDGKYALVTH